MKSYRVDFARFGFMALSSLTVFCEGRYFHGGDIEQLEDHVVIMYYDGTEWVNVTYLSVSVCAI